MPCIINNKSLNLNNPASIRIAIIESTLKISEHVCTVFHIMLEDDLNHVSLIRFIQDFKELDKLLFQYFPNHRLSLPKLNNEKSFSFFAKKKKSNSKLLETYLLNCITSRIGKSSLFRDFLSIQRDEDRIISKFNMVTQNNSNIQIPPPLNQDSRHDSGLTLSICKKTSMDDYETVKVLGIGATGKVVLVKNQHSKQYYAIKTIKKLWTVTQREVKQIRMEREILATIASIQHPFLVRLYSAFQDQYNLYLVLDYHAGADLATLLQRYVRFPSEQCRLYAAEILMGLQELHRHRILYRDLKPENVLLASDGHLVITDFGLSKMLDENTDHHTNTFCGTPEYLAPEIILGEDYSYAADLWSLGTMLYEMITGITPFSAESTDEMYDRIIDDPLVFPKNFDPEALDLISGLLERNPNYRLGAGFGGVFELRIHPYFANHLNWKDVYAKRIKPSYIPYLQNEGDLSHFDPEFLNMSINDDKPQLSSENYPVGMNASAFSGFTFNLDDEISLIESESPYYSSDFVLYDQDLDQDVIMKPSSLLTKENHRHSMLQNLSDEHHNETIGNSQSSDDILSWRS